MTRLSHLIKYLRFGGGKYKCNICKKSIRKFFPFSENIRNLSKKYGFAYDFNRMETLNIKDCNCPFCLSFDRERLYLLFLENYLKDKKNQPLQMLDFAPKDAFAANFKNKLQFKYESADLYRKDVDLNLDICNMETVMDSIYDIIICSHILEHVENPQKALDELYRILKKDGIAIIMVPLFWDVKETIDDKPHQTEEDRWRYYGQFDHVRLYSKSDFISQIKSSGFTLREYLPTDFPEKLINLYAIASNSILYVGYK